MIVRFTIQANTQLGAILDFVRERNPRAADQLAARIERACGQLSENPRLGRRQDVKGVRRKVVHPGGHLIYYRIDDENQAIEILAISHPAQQRPYNDS